MGGYVSAMHGADGDGLRMMMFAAADVTYANLTGLLGVPDSSSCRRTCARSCTWNAAASNG